MRARLLALIALAAPGAAFAQDTPAEPVVIPLPPVQASPTPAPTPTPSATPTPRPTASPTPRPTPTPSATPTPRPSTTPSPAPSATPTPAASPTPALVTDSAAPGFATPPTEVAPTAPVTPPQVAETPWWAYAAAGLVAVAALAAFLLRRRRKADDAVYEDPAEDAVAPPPAPPAPIAPPPPPPVPPVPPVAEREPPRTRARSGLVLDFRPQRLRTQGPDAVLDFELVITNTDRDVADGIRVVLVLASAGPDSAHEIAAFHANAAHAPTPEPFALQPGQGIALEGELTLRGDDMTITEVGGRALVVPLALINVRWRGGLAVRQAGEALVIGAGEASAPKLAPIWVDRAGASYDRLQARRFDPRS